MTRCQMKLLVSRTAAATADAAEDLTWRTIGTMVPLPAGAETAAGRAKPTALIEAALTLEAAAAPAKAVKLQK